MLRVASRGSQSFAAILRYSMFSLGPMFLELGLVIITIAFIFPWYFSVAMLGSVILYIGDTVLMTEWRARYFINQNNKDNAYNQIATDSLLNYETVKYFNSQGGNANI